MAWNELPVVVDGIPISASRQLADLVSALQSGARPTAHGKGERYLSLFDDMVTDETLRSTCRPLFADGYYAQAVERAFVCVVHAVRAKSSIVDQYGISLMRKAFGSATPVLALNDLRSLSDKDEQEGYSHLFAGSVQGIRNPRSHEHLEDTPEEALESLVIANHLMRKLNATRYCPSQLN